MIETKNVQGFEIVFVKDGLEHKDNFLFKLVRREGGGWDIFDVIKDYTPTDINISWNPEENNIFQVRPVLKRLNEELYKEKL